LDETDYLGFRIPVPVEGNAGWSQVPSPQDFLIQVPVSVNYERQ
jgi:hypothetical protein